MGSQTGNHCPTQQPSGEATCPFGPVAWKAWAPRTRQVLTGDKDREREAPGRPSSSGSAPGATGSPPPQGSMPGDPELLTKQCHRQAPPPQPRLPPTGGGLWGCVASSVRLSWSESGISFAGQVPVSRRARPLGSRPPWAPPAGKQGRRCGRRVSTSSRSQGPSCLGQCAAGRRKRPLPRKQSWRA